MDGEAVIRLESLTKTYGAKTAVREVSLSVSRGSIFGFLGPNGAGKSTTIQMMLRLIRPTSGTVRFFGQDVHRDPLDIASRVAALLEQPAFAPHLSGRRNLRLLASVSGIRDRARIEEAIEWVQLGEAADRPFRTYSQGMRQALGLARVYMQRPEVAILDEPTNGLDPEAILGFRKRIRNLRDEHGTTFFISSHLLHEIETVCDSVAILRDGRVLLTGRVDDLLQPDTEEVEVRLDDADRGVDVLGGVEGVLAMHSSGNGELRLRIQRPHAASINAALVQAGLAVSAFSPRRKTLEDFFLEHIGGDAT